MASKSSPIFSSILRQLRPCAQRAAPLQHRLNLPIRSPFAQPIFIRAAHSIPRPPARQPSNQTQATAADEGPVREGKRPELKDPAYYQLSFTCVPCGFRSHHNVSKQGYHKGSTLITCPECRNRHVISDHLNIFGDRKITVEDLMREKGQLVKRGSLGEDGDIEFWPEESYAQQEEGTEKTGGS
ncbi:Fc.00g065140.m01.CDS01 [Cosmosporella sp. VM-42]